MRLSFEIQGVEQSAERIEGGSARCFIAVAKEMGLQMLVLRNYAVTNTMHGQIVNQRSGNLARSTVSTTETAGETVAGRVGVPDDNSAPYARILHEGGTTRAHIIEVQNARTLAFVAGGQMIFRRLVNHPGSKFAPRPYLAAALDAQKEQIRAALAAAIEQAL
jgi:hypothetical protein